MTPPRGYRSWDDAVRDVPADWGAPSIDSMPDSYKDLVREEGEAEAAARWRFYKNGGTAGGSSARNGSRDGASSRSRSTYASSSGSRTVRATPNSG